jgi:WD40 repeat protein
MPRLSLLISSVALFTCAAPLAADETAAPATPKITFDEHIRPIFREHCLNCHNQDAKKGDLAIDSYAATMRGGGSGEVVTAGDPDGSRLFALVNHTDTPKMPPEQPKLDDAKLQAIKAWIAGGALENSGSVAKPKKKPAIDLAASAGAGKPSGAPIMPSGLFRQPVVSTLRPGAVTALAASPWAPLIAVGGQKQVLLYNSDTGALLGVLPFPEGLPYVLKFNRSGALLLAGGGTAAKLGRVVVFDVRDGKRVFEVGDELDAVLAADMNENNTLIALGGPSKVVRIFSTADGSIVHELRKHTDWIYSVEFSPDGVLLASADRSAGVFVWEAQTGREFQNLAGHKGAVTDVSWRDDSNVLATASEDGSIKLWEMENGGQIKNWNAHGGGVAAVRFAHDGRLVSTGRDRTTKLWDGNGAQQRAFEALNDIGLKVAVTHDAGRVIAGDWTGDVRVWSCADGNRLAMLPPNPPTLEKLIQAEVAKLAMAQQAVDKAAGELASANQELAAKLKAIEEHAAAIALAETAAKKSTVDRDAAKAVVEQKEAEERSVTERLAQAKAAVEAAGGNDPAMSEAATAAQAQLEKLAAEKPAIVKAATDAVAAAQAAEERVNALKAAAGPLGEAKNAAEQGVAAKVAAQKAASDALTQAQATHQQIVAEKAAYDAAQVAAQTAANAAPAAQ